MFKTQVEPRAAGEWFHCQVKNKDKLRAELALLSDEKACTLHVHLTSFLLSVLL